MALPLQIELALLLVMVTHLVAVPPLLNSLSLKLVEKQMESLRSVDSQHSVMAQYRMEVLLLVLVILSEEAPRKIVILLKKEVLLLV